MSAILYRIQFYGDWHCGSGLSSGADLDQLCIKDEDGLPYVPGKTIKGLLREAAENLYNLSNNEDWEKFVLFHFGQKTTPEENVDRSQTGYCHFSNAELSSSLRNKIIAAGEKHKESIFRKIASTALDDKGQAREHSLRKIEVAIPFPLFGRIDACKAPEKMKQCLAWIKRLGINRHRGLGRCDILIEEDRA